RAIGKGRDIAHVYAGADDAASLAHRMKCERHQVSDRCIDDCRIERLGGFFVRASCPGGAELQGKILRSSVSRPRESQYLAPLLARALRDDMRRRAKTI